MSSAEHEPSWGEVLLVLLPLGRDVAWGGEQR